MLFPIAENNELNEINKWKKYIDHVIFHLHVDFSKSTSRKTFAYHRGGLKTFPPHEFVNHSTILFRKKNLYAHGF